MWEDDNWNVALSRDRPFGSHQLCKRRREEGGGKREDGRGRREEGRGKREEGGGRREGGRGKREEGRGEGQLRENSSPQMRLTDSKRESKGAH